jgi:hypothetical protein
MLEPEPGFSPLMVLGACTNQAKEIFGKLLVMLMEVWSPLQMLCWVGSTCTLAVGKTLISISTGATLVQPTLAVRVTVAVLLVLLVKMSGAIVVVFTPEPLVSVKPCTSTALSSSQVTV